MYSSQYGNVFQNMSLAAGVMHAMHHPAYLEIVFQLPF
jgi:hypothetical protein